MHLHEKSMDLYATQLLNNKELFPFMLEEKKLKN
jgi:hypothetical protein